MKVEELKGSGDTPTYALSRWLFLRLLGVVYLVAFVSLGVQLVGLVGERGIFPVGRYLAWAHQSFGGGAYRFFPTLLWLGSSDAALRFLCWGGAALSALLIAGVAPMPVLALLWLFYLSLAVAGQAFLWFQWDALLLETGLLAILYAPAAARPSLTNERQPSALMRWLLAWLLFRLMFLSGITKLLSGDPTWRHLTALDYHFWTQPLPTWTAWYVQQLPQRIHAIMTLGMYGAELGAPWLLLAPPRLARLRVAGAALIALSQLGIAATGNYGFFNLLTLVLCVPVLDDGLLRRVLPLPLAAGEPEPRVLRLAIRVVAPALFVLSTVAFLREMTATVPEWRGSASVRLEEAVLAPLEPFRSINGYGLFRVMTTERPEIVVEGSRDSLRWEEYQFRWKPGAVSGRPGFVAPHMPRLDWQMWFAALDPRGHAELLGMLAQRLLEGSPAVTALLSRNPFEGRPPRWVRLVYYRYRFATAEERAQAGAWWDRDFEAYLTPALSLDAARR